MSRGRRPRGTTMVRRHTSLNPPRAVAAFGRALSLAALLAGLPADESWAGAEYDPQSGQAGVFVAVTAWGKHTKDEKFDEKRHDMGIGFGLNDTATATAETVENAGTVTATGTAMQQVTVTPGVGSDVVQISGTGSVIATTGPPLPGFPMGIYQGYGEVHPATAFVEVWVTVTSPVVYSISGSVSLDLSGGEFEGQSWSRGTASVAIDCGSARLRKEKRRIYGPTPAPDVDTLVGEATGAVSSGNCAVGAGIVAEPGAPGGTMTATYSFTMTFKPCTILGTEGNNSLPGTPGDDVICGLGGDDTITGGDGDDLILAGAGNDTVEAGDGDDEVDGGAGDDFLGGGAGMDRIAGGPGDDSIFGDDDTDTIDGGAGDDGIVGGDGADIIEGGPGADHIRGGAGGDIVCGDVLDPVSLACADAGGSPAADGDHIDGGYDADHLLGGPGADVIKGNGGDDQIEGDDGDDDLKGNTGRDKLRGGAGIDKLNGGPGEDVLVGGPGADLLIGCDGGPDHLKGNGGSDTGRVDVGLEVSTEVETFETCP